MTLATFRVNAQAGKAAVFVEPNATGSIRNIDAPRNAPLKTPLAHLDLVKFHSDFDYLEYAFRASATVNHASVGHSGYSTSAGSIAGDGITVQPTSWRSAPVVVTHTLYTHSLGIVPHVLVQLDGEIITPGYEVQLDSAAGMRLLTVLVDTSTVKLREMVMTWAGTLGAISRDYVILGLKKAGAAEPGKGFHAAAGVVSFGGGRIDSSRRFIRAAAEGEADTFTAPNGQTGDASNGVMRTASAAGVERDDAVFGTTAYNYNGSFGAGDVATKQLSIADENERAGASFTGLADGRLMVVDNGRVVLDSNRSMLKLIEEISLSNVDFVFPNPEQDSNTYWRNSNDTPASGAFPHSWKLATHATWKPQEWSLRTVLASLPTDKANFLVGYGRCTQTVAPAQVGGSFSAISLSAGPGDDTGWEYGSIGSLRNIQKGVPEATDMMLNGTLLLELYYMFRRVIWFAIEDDELVAYQQMSIGGYDTDNSTYRGPQGGASGANFGSANREVLARLHRAGARLSVGAGTWPSGGSFPAGATGYNPSGAYDWGSTWRFNLNFLVGHMSDG